MVESFDITPENKEYFKDLRHNECIVSAANLYELTMPDGTIQTIVLPMVRHYSPDAHQHLELWNELGIKWKELGQGFITNQYRYLDRKQALSIARRQGQLKRSIGYEPDELYSEMLY